MEGKTRDGPFLWDKEDDQPHFEINIYSDQEDAYTFHLRIRHFLTGSLFVTHVPPPVILATTENITDIFIHNFLKFISRNNSNNKPLYVRMTVHLW